MVNDTIRSKCFAGAATVAGERVELFAADPTDHRDTATHELEGEGAGVLQHPEPRRLVGRVVFHQRPGAGADAAGDLDLASGGAMGGGVAAVAEHSTTISVPSRPKEPTRYPRFLTRNLRGGTSSVHKGPPMSWWPEERTANSVSPASSAA